MRFLRTTPIILALALAAAIAPASVRHNAVPTASAAAVEYAQVITGDALLYRNAAGETARAVYFLLPEGYYVRLVSETVTNGKRAVEYDDLIGYVKASDIEPVSYVPKYRYAAGALKAHTKDGNSSLLREYPEIESESLIEGGIAFGSDGIKFYNLCAPEGDWYYVIYDDVRGYMSTASIAVTAPLAPPSTEAVVDPPPDGPGDDPKPPLQSDGRVWLIVAAIGIPALLIVLLIFRPGRRSSPPPRRVPRYYDE